MITLDNFTRVNNDVNGNPRYVLHFLDLNTDAERNAVPWIDISAKYDLALARSRAQGGRKFHNKQYGGGRKNLNGKPFGMQWRPRLMRGYQPRKKCIGKCSNAYRPAHKPAALFW